MNKVMPQPTDADRRAALRKAVAARAPVRRHERAERRHQLRGVALYEQAQRAGELQVRAYLAHVGLVAATTEADLDRMDGDSEAPGRRRRR